MAVNFLRNLADPMRSPSMPFNPAPAPVAMPTMGGNLQQMTQGAPEASRAVNIMQAIGGTPDTPPVQMPQQQPVQQPAPRQRRSFLETIGRISDVIATVGGAQALYQPTLDAREDRARQVDLEALRKQQIEQQMQLGGQQLQIGEQTLEANEDELASSGRARLATALGSLAGNPDAARIWPQIAAQAGLDEQQTAQIGGLIAQGIAPEQIARGLGWSPEVRSQGSQAKELQIYQMLRENAGEETAQAYLQNLTNPQGMTEKQIADLELARQRYNLDRDRFDFEQYKFENPQEKPSAATSAAEAGDSNSVASILTDFGVVLDGPNDPIADMINESTNGFIQYGASMIPGAFGVSTPGMEQIAKLQTIDNALILALAGGKLGAGVSNADRSFFEKMAGRISDPTIPADQRLAAWNQIKTRFRGVIQREAKAKPRTSTGRTGSGERVLPRTQRGQRPGTGNIVSVTSAEEARNLPSGTRFRTPDGRVMVKR